MEPFLSRPAWAQEGAPGGSRKASEQPESCPWSRYSPHWHQHRLPNLPPGPFHHQTVPLLVSASGFSGQKGDCSHWCD